MIKRPPQHAADAAPLYISTLDDAWDTERIDRERVAMKNEGGGQHPIDAYHSGSTRYDLDAPHTIGGQVITARHYLREGSTPTVFHLQRVGGLRSTQARAVAGDPRAWAAALWDLAKHGVVKVTEGFLGPAWDLQGGGPMPLTDADIDKLYDAHRMLPQLVGFAVLHASAPLSEAEGKP